jgi:transcriptional regulator with XRE-family HTH domain
MTITAFWNRVQKLLIDRGKTQKNLAEACEIPFNTLRGWKAKQIFPSLPDAVHIARFLGVSLDALVSESRRA